MLKGRITASWVNKIHTRSKLLGVALAIVLVIALAAPVYALPPQALEHSNHNHNHFQAPITTGSVLHITGTGTATKIGNRTIHDSASLDLTAKVGKVSHGNARLNITGGTLTIGSTTFTVVEGRGMINFHSDKVIIHVTLKNGSGNTTHLILFGKAANLPKSLGVNDSFTVNFKMPQSKLAGKWFLAFPGATVTRVS
jgi:hypothetical protein